MSIFQAWDGNKKQNKLVVVRFYLYKCGASLNIALLNVVNISTRH